MYLHAVVLRYGNIFILKLFGLIPIAFKVASTILILPQITDSLSGS
jgi:hypothetical protein